MSIVLRTIAARRRKARLRANQIRSAKRFMTLRKRTTIPRGQRGFLRSVGIFGKFGRGGELKFFDQDVTDALIAANWTIQTNATPEASFIRIPEGTSASTRIGRKITIRKIMMRYNLTLPAQTNPSSTSDVVRIVIYLDKQCNGTAATIGTIFESDDVQSFRNIPNIKRYGILYDRTISMNCIAGGPASTTSTNYGERVIAVNVFLNVNIPIEYNATNTGALATIRSNNIGMVFGSETGLVQFNGRLRLRYTDL